MDFWLVWSDKASGGRSIETIYLGKQSNPTK